MSRARCSAEPFIRRITRQTERARILVRLALLPPAVLVMLATLIEQDPHATTAELLASPLGAALRRHRREHPQAWQAFVSQLRT